MDYIETYLNSATGGRPIGGGALYLKIPPPPPPVHAHVPQPWPPDWDNYLVLRDDDVGAAVRIWAALHRGPHTYEDLREVVWRTSCTRLQVCMAKLRERVPIISRPHRSDRRLRVYELAEPSTLWVRHSPDGVYLAPLVGERIPGLEFEVRCTLPAGGLPRIERVVPINLAPPPQGAWRPDYGPNRAPHEPPPPPRSLPVWTWGLLKGRARSMQNLMDELGVLEHRAHSLIRTLRQHGHPVTTDMTGRLFIPEGEPPLLCFLMGHTLMLTGRSRKRMIEIP